MGLYAFETDAFKAAERELSQNPSKVDSKITARDYNPRLKRLLKEKYQLNWITPEELKAFE